MADGERLAQRTKDQLVVCHTAGHARAVYDDPVGVASAGAGDQLLLGLRGDEIPCQIMTTDPGDVVMFHHCLYHAVYAKSGRRRYIAFKFAARPTRAEHIALHRKWQRARNIQMRDALRNSSNPRIRRMVEGLAELELGADDE